MRTSIVILIIVAILGSSRAAVADCTEDGSGCPGLTAALAGVVVGGVTEGSIAVGGLTTMIGGAVDLRRGGHKATWRVANLVFGIINLTAGVLWGSFAAAGSSPQLTVGFAVPHLAVGIGDVVVAGISFSRR
jgi:hypothetical protein